MAQRRRQNSDRLEELLAEAEALIRRQWGDEEALREGLGDVSWQGGGVGPPPRPEIGHDKLGPRTVEKVNRANIDTGLPQIPGEPGGWERLRGRYNYL